MRLIFSCCLLITIAVFPAHAQVGNPLVEEVRTWDFQDGDTLGWGQPNDIADLRVENGVLRGRCTGPDANISLITPGFDASEVTHAQFSIRCSQPGVTAIYFATDQNPNPAENASPIAPHIRTSDFRVSEVKLEGVKGWKGQVTYFRMDPMNSVQGTGEFEIDWIRLVRRPPCPLAVSFTPIRMTVAPGEPLDFVLRAVNLGDSQMVAAEITTEWNGSETRLGRGNLDKMKEGLWESVASVTAPQIALLTEMTPVKAGLYENEQLLSTITTYLFPEKDSPIERIENGDTALVLIGNKDGALAARMEARVDGEWRSAGLVYPLAFVSGLLKDEASNRLTQYAAPVALKRTAPGAALKGASPFGVVTLALGPASQPGCFQANASLEPDKASTLLRFSGPVLLAGEGADGAAKNAALFPGIEYLSAAGVSSDIASAGDTFGYRPIPNPKHITVPLMAVEKQGFLCGLMWDPLQPWRGDEVMPMVEFAAPNFLDGQDNIAMGLFAPSAPVYGEFNQRLAVRGCPIAPGDNIRLASQLFVRVGGKIEDAVPLWYAAYGQPQPITPVKPLESFMNDVMTGYSATCYDAPKDAFFSHWRMDGAGPSPYAKAGLLSDFLATSDREHIDRVKVDPGARLGAIMGDLSGELQAQNMSADIATQREDGSWPYECASAVRDRCLEFTKGKLDTLGRPGDTNSGLIATKSVGILLHALRTGDPASVESGLKALKALRSQRVPVGAQTWEVHMDAPDIYAAGVAVDCFRMGYELTGDAAYLDDATRWAYTGLPFLYSWRVPGTGPGVITVVPGDPATPDVDPFEGWHGPDEIFDTPDRQFTPYASIPVFGTSFYAVGWFGSVVQWCGLRYANSVYQLLDYRDDPILRKAADGVLISGCHQTLEKSPVTGILPDVYVVHDNMLLGAFIGPGVLDPTLRRKLGRTHWGDVTTRVLRHEGASLHLNARGPVLDAAWEGGMLSWTSIYPAGQSADAVVRQCPAIEGVMVDGAPLSKIDALTPETESGWAYDAANKTLSIRVPHAGEACRVEVRLGER